MRYIYLLLITFIFASCGNHKMRFLRATHSKKQEIVTRHKLEKELVQADPTETIVVQVNTEMSTPENKVSGQEQSSDQIDHQQITENPSDDISEKVTDTIRSGSVESSVIEESARRAQNKGIISTVFGVLGGMILVISALVGVFIWTDIIIYVGAVVSLIFAITAIVFGILSLVSDYNTKTGRHTSIVGLAWAVPIIISALLLIILLG